MKKKLAGLFLLLFYGCMAVAAAPVATVFGGKISGLEKNGVVNFKGIPFAAPPLGDLRWRAPQPVVPWSGVRLAQEYGFDCLQNPFPGDAAPLGGPISEDCLYLNVWRPAGDQPKPLPVMVWIYGGGYVNGGSSPTVYSGERFAESGVVFVSFNYRLGRFGFFAHPALTAENADGVLGNYAFMDQVAALQWVKKNIAQFGGDPNNVTIFGESAGGGSVNTLLTANPKYVEGLFHKAIAQSGGGRTRGWWATPLRAQDAVAGQVSGEEKGVAFAQAKGIKASGSEALQQLRKLPAADIVNGMNMAQAQPDTYAGPMIDGELVVQPAEDAFRKGEYQRVPYLAGANSFEWAFMVDFMPDMVRGLARDFLQKTGVSEGDAIKLFNTQSHRDPLALLGGLVQGDTMFIEPARFVTRQLAQQGNKSWLYRFDYVTESERGKTLGAYHATEIPFVFKTIDARYKALSASDHRMADALHQRWVTFAKTGMPAQKDGWYSVADEPEALWFFSKDQGKFVIDPLKARLDLVEKYIALPH